MAICSRISSIRSLIVCLSPNPSKISVSSFEITTFFADPSTDTSAFSSVIPTSSEISCPPVSVAISCIKFLRLSPNPGDLTAHTFSPPRSLLTTKVASASLSTSSAMISSARPVFIACSRRCKIGWIAVTFFSVRSSSGLSNSHFCVFVSVTK